MDQSTHSSSLRQHRLPNVKIHVSVSLLFLVRRRRRPRCALQGSHLDPDLWVPSFGPRRCRRRHCTALTQAITLCEALSGAANSTLSRRAIEFRIGRVNLAWPPPKKDTRHNQHQTDRRADSQSDATGAARRGGRRRERRQVKARTKETRLAQATIHPPPICVCPTPSPPRYAT